jgi:cell division protein FtsQ
MTIPTHITQWIIRIIWILFGIAVIVLFGAAIQFKKKQVCTNINIEISGAEKHMFIDELDVKELVNANGDVIGLPIHALSLRKLESSVEQNAWVKNAEMFFDNNQVLQIRIEERQPIARIFETTGKSYYIDTALVLLPLSNKLTSRVPVFTGVNAQSPKKDTAILSQIAVMANYIVADSFFTAQIAQIDLNLQHQFELVPSIGEHIVIFGDTSDLVGRFEKLKNFYRNNWFDAGFTKYEQLNLQYRNQIVATQKGTAKMIADSAAAKALIANTAIIAAPSIDSAITHDKKIKSLPVPNNKKTVKPLTNGVKPKTLKKHTL